MISFGGYPHYICTTPQKMTALIYHIFSGYYACLAVCVLTRYIMQISTYTKTTRIYFCNRIHEPKTLCSDQIIHPFSFDASWDWTVSSTYSDLTAFSTSSVLCFHHLTTFMLRLFVSFEIVKRFSPILTFITWVLLYVLLFLIVLLLFDQHTHETPHPSFLYYLLNFSLLKPLNCIIYFVLTINISRCHLL